MPGLLPTQKINNTASAVYTTTENEFRVLFTGNITEIRCWGTGITAGLNLQYHLIIENRKQEGAFFNVAENDTQYAQTSLEIPVIKGQRGVFAQMGGTRPHNAELIFIFETEVP